MNEREHDVAGRTKRLLSQHGEKLRYLITGAWNTVFGYGLFLVLLPTAGTALRLLQDSQMPLLALVAHDYYLICGWLGWILAVPQSTWTMKHFAFRSEGRLLPQVGRAYFVYLPAQGLSTILLWLAVRVLQLTPALGGALTIAVTTVFSYLGHKYFTFRMPLEVGEIPARTLVETDVGGGETPAGEAEQP